MLLSWYLNFELFTQDVNMSSQARLKTQYAADFYKPRTKRNLLPTFRTPDSLIRN